MPNRKVAPKIKKNFRGYNSFLCHRKDLVTLKREVLSYDVNAPLRMHAPQRGKITDWPGPAYA